MRRTRYMSWVFLVLSLAFFTIRDFRFALEAPLASLWAERMFGWFSTGASGPRYTPWLARLYTLDRYAAPAKLVALADQAGRRGDSEFVAFAALNLGPRKESLRLADRAVDANPDLTWIYFFVVSTGMSPSEWQGPSEVSREDLARRIDQLETFDSDNAVPHILSAQFIRDGRGKEWPSGSPAAPAYLAALARETAWCQEMDKAFRSPRYSSYEIRYFKLIRSVLRAHGWDHPVVVETTTGLRSSPNFLQLREYTNLLVLKYGAEAAAAGKLNEALDNYFLAAEFGDRLRRQGSTLIEDLVGIAVQRISYPKLARALRKSGREKEARVVEDVDRQVMPQLNRTFRNPLLARSYRFWLVLLVNFAAGLVVVFLLASLISVGYVNAKLWVRREKKGRMYQTLTVAENYAPLLLFLSCLALYLGEVPFGRQYENYMTAQQNLYDPSVRASIYPAWGLNEPNAADVPNAFQDYVPVALGGLILLTGVLAWGLWRERRKESLPEPAAFERKLQTQNYAVLLFVALAAGAFVLIETPWEMTLTAEIVFGLLLAAALWTSASFARRARKNEIGSRAAIASEVGAYLLLLVLAVVSGFVVGVTVQGLMRSHRLRADDWAVLAWFGLPPLVAGVMSARRMRFRRATPAVFGLLVVSMAGLVLLPVAIHRWRSRKESQAAKTNTWVQPFRSALPPLTKPELLVSLAEGKPTETLAREAENRGTSLQEVFDRWELREAGANDELIKTLRSTGRRWWWSKEQGPDAQRRKAEQTLRADVKKDPNNPFLHFALGLVHLWQEKWDVATAEYRIALRLKPDFASAHRALGEALTEKQQLDAGIAELRQAVRLDPNDALAHRDLAAALPDPQDRDEIIREYKAELDLEPDDSDARLSLALSLKENGEYGDAAGEFRDLLSRDPGQLRELSIRLEFAEALRRSGKLDEAITEYRELVRLHPTSGTAHDGLGEVLAENDELTAAIPEFQEAIRLSPGSASAHNDLGLALQRAGHLDGAITEFQQAIHVGASSAEIHTNLARTLEKKGDLKDALEQYRIASRLKPKDSETQADFQRLSRQLSHKQ